MATVTPVTPTVTTELYGGEIRLDFFEQYGRKKHVYMVDGQETPSVTKILDVLDKPALIAWAVNEMEAFLLRECKPGMVIDEVDFRQLVARAKNARYQKSDEGKAIGSIVHDWIEFYVGWKLVMAAAEAEGIDGVENPFHQLPVHKGARSGCEAFLKWEDAHKVEWLASEMKVYSRQHRYCGTFDFIARIDGKLTLGDFKTTKVNSSTGSGIYPEYWLQTAAYQWAYGEMGNPFGTIDQRMIVRLGKEPDSLGNIDFETAVSTNFADDMLAFLSCLTIQRRIAELSVKGGA